MSKRLFVVPVCVFCVFFPFILDINCLMINVLVQSPLRPYFYFFCLSRRYPFLSVLFCLLSLLISERFSGLISFGSVYLYKNVYSRNFGALRRPFKCHEEVLYLQPLIPPKRFDPNRGMLRRSRCVLIFLQTTLSGKKIYRRRWEWNHCRRRCLDFNLAEGLEK